MQLIFQKENGLVSELSACNNPKLRESPKALDTTLKEKFLRGTRLIAEPNGNNSKDEQWTIRSQTSKSAMIRTRGRFRDYNGLGLRRLILFYDVIRYSPAIKET
jgi:hypothetical protein